MYPTLLKTGTISHNGPPQRGVSRPEFKMDCKRLEATVDRQRTTIANTQSKGSAGQHLLEDHRSTPVVKESAGKTYPKPSTPWETVRDYSIWLTDFEKDEIQHYPEVYFCGPWANKGKRVPFGNNNHGYDDPHDDRKGHYYHLPKDHLAYRYEFKKVIGKGTFGQVAEVYDHKERRHVALKTVRRNPAAQEMLKQEVDLLRSVRRLGVPNAVRMLDTFIFRQHICVIFELLSYNLTEFMGKKRVDAPLAAHFSHSILQCLKHLRRHGLMHGDLKPDNIALKCVDGGAYKLKVIDFGCSLREKTRYKTPNKICIQSLFYRAPEVILGCGFGPAIDMWSFGCILAEMVMGRPLFTGSNEEQQIALIMEVLGKPPEKVLQRASKRRELLDERDNPKYFKRSQFGNAYRRNIPIGNPGSRPWRAVLSSCEDQNLIDLIEKCLRWDPSARLPPHEAFNHPWLIAQLQPQATPSLMQNDAGRAGPLAQNAAQAAVDNRPATVVVTKTASVTQSGVDLTETDRQKAEEVLQRSPNKRHKTQGVNLTDKCFLKAVKPSPSPADKAARPEVAIPDAPIITKTAVPTSTSATLSSPCRSQGPSVVKVEPPTEKVRKDSSWQVDGGRTGPLADNTVQTVVNNGAAAVVTKAPPVALNTAPPATRSDCTGPIGRSSAQVEKAAKREVEERTEGRRKRTRPWPAAAGRKAVKTLRSPADKAAQPVVTKAPPVALDTAPPATQSDCTGRIGRSSAQVEKAAKREVEEGTEGCRKRTRHSLMVAADRKALKTLGSPADKVAIKANKKQHRVDMGGHGGSKHRVAAGCSSTSSSSSSSSSSCSSSGSCSSCSSSGSCSSCSGRLEAIKNPARKRGGLKRRAASTSPSQSEYDSCSERSSSSSDSSSGSRSESSSSLSDRRSASPLRQTKKRKLVHSSPSVSSSSSCSSCSSSSSSDSETEYQRRRRQKGKIVESSCDDSLEESPRKKRTKGDRRR